MTIFLNACALEKSVPIVSAPEENPVLDACLKHAEKQIGLSLQKKTGGISENAYNQTSVIQRIVCDISTWQIEHARLCGSQLSDEQLREQLRQPECSDSE